MFDMPLIYLCMIHVVQLAGGIESTYLVLPFLNFDSYKIHSAVLLSFCVFVGLLICLSLAVIN